MLASAAGYTDVVLLLLQRGADTSRPTVNQQFTALHLAAEKSHALIVEALLEKGSAADARGYMNWTPLYLYASQPPGTRLSRLMFDRQRISRWPPRSGAAAAGRPARRVDPGNRLR